MLFASHLRPQIFIHNEPFYEAFDPSQMVYLSPESENVLEDIDDNTVYIVGAIADHNRLKVFYIISSFPFYIKG